MILKGVSLNCYFVSTSRCNWVNFIFYLQSLIFIRISIVNFWYSKFRKALIFLMIVWINDINYGFLFVFCFCLGKSLLPCKYYTSVGNETQSSQYSWVIKNKVRRLFIPTSITISRKQLTLVKINSHIMYEKLHFGCVNKLHFSTIVFSE